MKSDLGVIHFAISVRMRLSREHHKVHPVCMAITRIAFAVRAFILLFSFAVSFFFVLVHLVCFRRQDLFFSVRLQ